MSPNNVCVGCLNKKKNAAKWENKNQFNQIRWTFSSLLAAPLA